MKLIAIRTLVLVLAVAGFSASSVFSASAAKASQPNVVLANAGPTPLCPPVAGGTLCGIH